MNRRQALALLAAAAVPPAAAARKYHIIDPHVQVWKNDARFPWSKETANPPVQDATPEMLIDLMRANGVEKTVIVQVIYYRWDNRYAAEALRRYPQYFLGVARVDPQSVNAPDDLSRLVEVDLSTACA